MNGLTIFKNEEFGEVRTVLIEGNPRFVGIDVAKILDYANPSKAVHDHCKGISKLGIPSVGGIQETNVISEGDVYRLIIKAADQSKNPEIKLKAEKFERWIFDEVLPSIRKHGLYASKELLNNPDLLIEMAQALKTERAEKERLQIQSKKDKPKVLFADAVSVSDGAILIGELAKILKGNGIEIGQNRLFEKLRQDGYFIKRKGSDYNSPTQKSTKLELFKIKETAITHSDGHITVNKTTKVTGKGQQYFVNYFLSEVQSNDQ